MKIDDPAPASAEQLSQARFNEWSAGIDFEASDVKWPLQNLQAERSRRLLAEADLEVETGHPNKTWEQDFPLWQRVPFLCRERYQWFCVARRVPH